MIRYVTICHIQPSSPFKAIACKSACYNRLTIVVATFFLSVARHRFSLRSKFSTCDVDNDNTRQITEFHRLLNITNNRQIGNPVCTALCMCVSFDSGHSAPHRTCTGGGKRTRANEHNATRTQNRLFLDPTCARPAHANK